MQEALGNLRTLHAAGFRMIGLVHFFDNAFAGSANGLNKGPLTGLGQDLVREMGKLGIILDLAHASVDTIDTTLEFIGSLNPEERPAILVSHTGAYTVHEDARNLIDRNIDAIVDAGGVIGIGYFKKATGGDRRQS